MTSDTIMIPFFQALTEDVNALAAPQDSLQETRREALERYAAIGLPTLKTEAWRFTNIQRFLKEYPYELTSTPATTTADVANEANIPGLDGYRIVLVNGHLQASLSTIPEGKGIRIGAMSASTDAPGFAKWFNQHAQVNGEALANLNTALFADGLFIELQANVSIDKPIHLIHVYTSDRHAFVQPRHLWILHKGAAATIIESTVHPKQEAVAFANCVTEVVVADNAELWHYNVQQGAENFRQVNTTAAQQEKDSRYHHFNITLPNTPFTRNNLSVVLHGSNTETNLKGIYLATENQHVDNFTFMNHLVPHCNSNEHYKGVLMGNANAVFTGRIHVHQEAQKTNAFQQNNNILIGDKASINSQPQLEIYADDVKCSHGFTAGQFSEEALFYLRARAIGEEAAKALLVNAFTYDVTSEIAVPALQEYIQGQIEAIMNN